MRGNLRPHHASTKHGDFFYDEITHEIKLQTIDIFEQRWIPACAEMAVLTHPPHGAGRDPAFFQTSLEQALIHLHQILYA